jgi:hypothetical protein
LFDILDDEFPIQGLEIRDFAKLNKAGAMEMKTPDFIEKIVTMTSHKSDYNLEYNQ